MSSWIILRIVETKRKLERQYLWCIKTRHPPTKQPSKPIKITPYVRAIVHCSITANGWNLKKRFKPSKLNLFIEFKRFYIYCFVAYPKHSNSCPIENVELFHSICRRIWIEEADEANSGYDSCHWSLYVYFIFHQHFCCFFRSLVFSVHLALSQYRSNTRLVSSFPFLSFSDSMNHKAVSNGKIENGSIWLRI